MDNNYVLAMYDVRGKQDYIFRGKKLKEIVGGSLVIKDIFDDELFPAAKIYRDGNEGCVQDAIFSYKRIIENNDFSREKFEEHLNNGYLGEVVYDGGGNFLVLYKDFETYREINKIFTRRVLEHTYSLTVLCSCIKGVDFDNYTTLVPEGFKKDNSGDREKLYLENRKREARINPQLPAQVLPFTQVDYANSLPLHKYNYTINSKLTKESSRKYEKYTEFAKTHREYDEKVLDNIVKEKGKDSWIAIMYIDGNNMGAKVQAALSSEETIKEPKKVTYEEAIKKLRDFSDKIQEEYVDKRIDAIDQRLADKYKDKEIDYKRRLVVYAGDEINIILNSHDVYDALNAYFEDMPKNGSACAGVAIFKSHTPYADAYQIAEQCCETGKSLMKKYNMKEVNFVDFHYCQGAIGTDIESIREREISGIISKPWMIGFNENQIGNLPKGDIVTTEMVEKMVAKLNTCSRTNIKGLLDCARNSEAELFTELTRMQLRRKGKDEDYPEEVRNLTEIKGMDDNDLSKAKIRNLIYDIVSIYDFWFRTN